MPAEADVVSPGRRRLGRVPVSAEPATLSSSAPPFRRLQVATFLTAAGSGLWYALVAIFLIRSVGLSAPEIGAGLTVAGTLGLATSVPIGRLADRVGPRGVLAAVVVLRAVAILGFVLVQSFWQFLLVASLAAIGDRSATGVRNALVSRLTVGQATNGVGAAKRKRRLDALVTLRVANTLGFAVGAALAGVALSIDRREVYVAAVVVNAATFAVYALAVLSMPRVKGLSPDERPPANVLRDRPYLVLTALSAVLALNWGILSTGLPLWVVERTDAPRWTVAGVVLLNSLLIAALQRPASQGSETAMPAAKRATVAGFLLAASCVVYSLTEDGSGGTAVALLLVAALVHVAGELLWVASSWGLSLALMPASAAGEYQATFHGGTSAAQSIAPILMTSLLIGLGRPGWFVLAAIFVLAALPTVPVAGWAVRTRQRAVA